MPIILQTTDTITVGVAVPIPFQVDLIVAGGVTVASTGNHAIDGAGDNIVIVNSGALVASTDDEIFDPAIQVGVVGGTSTANAVTIAEGATVLSAMASGIRVEHGTNTITNYGSVDAGLVGIVALGTSQVVNYGEVLGKQVGGVFVDPDGSLQNFGTISSNLSLGVNLFGNAGSLINSGLITGATTAVRLNASDPATAHGIVNNSGTLQGTDNGITSINSTITLTNSGIISSTNVDEPTIAFGLVGTSGENIIINSGSILSPDWAFDGHDGRDEIINTGTITGSINLNGGNDVYDGRNGITTGIIDGGAGNDLLVGGETADSFLGGGGNDRMFGLGGNDQFEAEEGENQMYGGAGDDFGTGGEGNDIIRGGKGDDFFDGGDGDDDMRGGQDRDELDGGLGEDLIYGGDGRDILSGEANRDTLFGGDGHDELYGGSSADALRGGMGGDTLDGGKGADLLYAGQGDDIVEGGDADDVIRGGAGDDTISGGAGADSITSGKGDDEIAGGGGADVFIMTRNTGNDHILDFADGIDTIDLTAFGLRPADFATIVAPAISNAGGGATFVDLDALGGDGSILIEGLTFGNADAADFIL